MTRNIQFESKLKQFQGSANQVVNYVLNRENVAPTNSPLQTKLASLHKRLIVAVADVTVRYSPSSCRLPVAQTQMFIRACVRACVRVAPVCVDEAQQLVQRPASGFGRESSGCRPGTRLRTLFLMACIELWVAFSDG